MKVRSMLLAGASIMATFVCGLGTSSAAEAQAATHATARAPGLQTMAKTLRPMSRDRLPAAARPAMVRPDVGGPIYTADANAVDAAGCGIPANVIEYPYVTNGCDSNGGENWGLDYQNGVYAIYAQYGGHDMCLNIRGGSYTSGTPILAWGCDSGPQPDEEFYLTATQYAGWFYIHSAVAHSLCLNVAGGNAPGNSIILYSCGDYSNEWFYLS